MTARDASAGPLSWQVVRGWLEASKYYWLVTSRVDGRPHARPVWGLWLESRFHFTMSPETVIARNVVSTGKALVHPESAVNVVIVEGPVQRTEGQALVDASSAYEAKYATRVDPNDAGMPFYSVEAQTAVAWVAHDPRGSAVRWTFER